MCWDYNILYRHCQYIVIIVSCSWMLEGLSLMTVISPALRSQWSEVQYLSFNRNKNTKDRDTITLTLTLSLGVNVEGTVNVFFSVNVNLINSIQGIKPPKLIFCTDFHL